MLHFPFILNAQYIDTKWTVTGYFGELWYAEEEDILGKQQEFLKDGQMVFFIPVITLGSLQHITPLQSKSLLRIKNLN